MAGVEAYHTPMSPAGFSAPPVATNECRAAGTKKTEVAPGEETQEGAAVIFGLSGLLGDPFATLARKEDRATAEAAVGDEGP